METVLGKDGRVLNKGFVEHNLKNLPVEERKRIARKSAETRKRDREERMALERCMQAILNLEVATEDQKRALQKMGIKGDSATNKTLLMASLFRKGLKGDVMAIREINTMMEKLENYYQRKTNKNNTQSININLIPKESTYTITPEIKEEIYKAENGLMDVTEETLEWDITTDDEEWGNDVYDG